MQNKAQVKPRYDWVDYSKGICIIAVVCLYSTNLAHESSIDAGWMQYWTDFAQPFRMPDFFLLSGLFLHNVIERSWRGYFDKKVVHYVYFFCLWTCISFAILLTLGEQQGSLLEMTAKLWSMLSSWPYKMLWFIQMLPAYFVLTKLTLGIPKWLMLSIAIVLQSYPLFHFGRTMLDEFWVRYVYFYIGYAFAPLFFLLAKQVQVHLLPAVCAVIVWIIVNSVFVFNGWSEIPIISLILGVAGASAIIAISALLSRLNAGQWLRYLGKHSIVIYLAFYWPMHYCWWLLVPYINSNNAGISIASVTMVGILGALIFYWLVKKMGFLLWLFERPKWMVFGNY
jgi:uncharacterized membrane protein YcfT